MANIPTVAGAPAGTQRGEVDVVSVGLDFNGQPALRNTELHVRAGEFFTLLGPSGSGKTTLLRIIAGLLEPDRGSIRIDGGDVTRVPTQRRDIGFVFQNYALFPHLTVSENIEFGLKVRKVPRGDRARRIAEIIELVALGGLGTRLPSQLSGGQQQRVALGRALAQRPRVLLLDEPLGALDRNLREDLGAEVRRIQQESQTTAIYVTHDQDEAFILSDRIGVMRDGDICQLGTPADVYRTPLDVFVARFLGRTNLFPVQVVSRTETATHVRTGSNAVIGQASRIDAGRDAFCCVRPEQLVVTAADHVPEGHDVLAGAVVTDARFLGNRQAVRLAVEGQTYTADLDPSREAPAPGAFVNLSVRTGVAAVVPRDDAPDQSIIDPNISASTSSTNKEQP